MYDNYKELVFEGLTRGKELRDAYILVFREKQGNRFFPVLLQPEGYRLVADAMNRHDFTCSHLMNRLAGRVGMTLIGVRLQPPSKGTTQALLDFELINEVVSISVTAAEATVAALETKAPFWVERSTFERQIQQPQAQQSMALPISAMGDSLIEDALKAAVEDENFELASVLRDELNQRKKSGLNNPYEA